MKRKFIIYLISLFLLITPFIIVIGNEPPIIMNFDEFINDYHSNTDNESRIITYYFQSLNPGDILIIEDTINTIFYNSTRGYTSIEFISYLGDTFPIEGDITDEFATGDVIEITVHIISVSFTDQHPSSGETWTFNIETFEEEWDDENQTYKLLSSEYIRLINGNNRLPICILTVEPTSGIVPLTVTLSLSASDLDGSISTWMLDINNDGLYDYTGSGNLPLTKQHTYQTAGSYTAQLMVTDNQGATDTDSKIIMAVSNQPPVAHFIYSIDEGMVIFTDTSNDSDGSVIFWNWDFGDGISSNLTNPTHTYGDEERYYATLTVTDNKGKTDTYSKIIIMTPYEKPVYHVGDYWEYNVIGDMTSGGEPIVLQGTGKIEIIERTTLTVDSGIYEVWKITQRIDAYADYQNSSLKLYTTEYIRTSDFANIKHFYDAEMTSTFEAESAHSEIIFISLQPDFEYPINVGDSWERHIEEELTDETGTRTRTLDTYYECTGTTEVNTENGSFLCYVLRSVQDEPQGDTYEIGYYSDEVGNFVKRVGYENGEQYITMTLKSYSYSGGETEDGNGGIPGFEFIPLILSIIGILVIFRKRNIS